MTSAKEWLATQQWWQELEGKWNELEPQQQLYSKVGSFLAISLTVLISLFNFFWTVRSLRNQISEKSELLTYIQNSNDELRHLRDTNSGVSAGDNSPWDAYVKARASDAGIDAAGVVVSPERPGAKSDIADESVLDVSVKHVSIKNVVRYAFGLETGQRPIKLKDLKIDTKADPAGYMDATLTISGFNLKETGK
jgi:hypothetical protein